MIYATAAEVAAMMIATTITAELTEFKKLLMPIKIGIHHIPSKASTAVNICSVKLISVE